MIKNVENDSLINHVFLLFKLQVYRSRKNHSLNLYYIYTNIRTVETLDKRIASVGDRKSKTYNKKWNVNCQYKR